VKHLILDKTVLYGTGTVRLTEFAGTHCVVLPDVLLYECATTQKDKELMLDRCREMVLGGARVCPSLKTMVQHEANTLAPYGQLVDPEWNHELGETFSVEPRPYNFGVFERRHKEDREFASGILGQIGSCTDSLQTECPDVVAKARQWDHSKKSRCDRLQAWVGEVDSRDLHEAATRLLPGITENPQKYCLSDEWVTWQVARVWLVWWLECNFQHQTGKEEKELNLEHDWQDLTYAALMGRVDALVTRDKFLRDLVQAAFPEKDVFSSLDEVPEKYLCHRS
jgi:transposase